MLLLCFDHYIQCDYGEHLLLSNPSILPLPVASGWRIARRTTMVAMADVVLV